MNLPLLMMTVIGAPLLVLVLAGGCDRSPQSGLRTVQMTIGNSRFTLEVADTMPTQQKGLMNRDSMPADHGMIFVFESDEPRAFWMHNTRIPLDILYVDSAGRIVSIRQMKPYDEE